MDVTTVFSRAAASQSSYAEGFLPLASLQDTSDKLFTELTGKGVTIDQAYSIAAQLMVVAQADTTDAGFSATLFESRKTGELILAMRGSDEIAPDWTAANLQNLISGVARQQVVDMLNFYLILTAPPGSSIAQYRYDTLAQSVTLPSPGPNYTLKNFTNNLSYYEGIVPTSTATGLGLLAAGTRVSATGHSLGGHLASAFALLLPHNILSVTTFNSAGFLGWLGSEFSNFAVLLGNGISEISISADPYMAMDVHDIASPTDWVSRLPGVSHLSSSLSSFAIEVSTGESPTPLSHGHYIDPLVDSLAVGNLIDVLTVGNLLTHRKQGSRFRLSAVSLIPFPLNPI
ncbi:MAG: hypothetical protein R3E54_10460 [Halioglobus sp.]